MWCLACLRPGELAVCPDCVRTMGPGPRRRLECGIAVSAGLMHQAAARRLVLRLKYRGCRESAEVLAAVMLPLIPSGASALAPVPRIYYRRIKYRSDPGLLLAGALSRRSGLPVSHVLGPRLWGGANAGLDRSARTAPPLPTPVDSPRRVGAGRRRVDHRQDPDGRRGDAGPLPGAVGGHRNLLVQRPDGGVIF